MPILLVVPPLKATTRALLSLPLLKKSWAVFRSQPSYVPPSLPMGRKRNRPFYSYGMGTPSKYPPLQARLSLPNLKRSRLRTLVSSKEADKARR